MMAAVEKANLPTAKLTAIITDVAPAMIGSVNGLVGLCKADQTFSEFWNFHCIIHREQLVSKSLKLDNVMKTLMEIINYICTHALHHRQFKNLIAELDRGLPGDLPLHCTVRWLSKKPGTLSLFTACRCCDTVHEREEQKLFCWPWADYGSSFFGQHALSLEQTEPEFAG